MLRLPILGNAVMAVALLSLCTVLQAQQGAGKVYKSVDEKGRVIFTDTQPKSRPSEEISVSAPNSSVAVAEKEDDSSEQVAVVDYAEFAIVSPVDNQALDYNVTALDVAVTVEPALQDGHKVHFFIDGKSYGKPGTSLSRRVTGLERGAHTAEARLRDKNGKMLMSTGVVRFYVRRSGDLENWGDDGEYDYPYNQRGFRGPRGAESAGGASEPGSAEGNTGARSAEGARSPWELEVPVGPAR